jgi:hypothetical protein
MKEHLKTLALWAGIPANHLRLALAQTSKETRPAYRHAVLVETLATALAAAVKGGRR